MEDQEAPAQLFPSVVLRKVILFPHTRMPLVVKDENILRGVQYALKGDGQLVLRYENVEGKTGDIGVLAKIAQHGNIANEIVGVVAEGVKRVKVTNIHTRGGLIFASIQDISKTSDKKNTKLEALSRHALEQFGKLIQIEGTLPITVLEDLQKKYITPEQVSDILSSVLPFIFNDKFELIEAVDVQQRLEILNRKINEEIKIAQTEREIEAEMSSQMQTQQREFILRQKLRAIEKELGISEEREQYGKLEEQLLEAHIPADAQTRVFNELDRLKRMPATSPEAPYITNWLEWISDLPWDKRSNATLDMKKAEDVLNKEHYGLQKVKERILEYLAVQKLTEGKSRGTILLFIGPPGVGKTSVGKSIADALGRDFVRVALGGLRDEAEIRGHRRTYVGARPGRIIQGIRNAKTKNPVFVLDEIDKVAPGYHGDPTAALLEVLDPAQNNTFTDYYIEIPFDLSQVFFIATANVLDTIPAPLLDRMDVVEFTGYTEDEKFHIAKQYLIPRVLTENGLKSSELIFTDRSIREVITRYTREAGVRNLERRLSEVARKVAKQYAEGNVHKKITVTEKEIEKYLGPKQFELTIAQTRDTVGVATGLAWTPVGGEILFIEAILTPGGKGNLTLTGQLGDVMKESARAALTYIKSQSDSLHIPIEDFNNTDLHIHVPAGAIPKDGPSAGISMAIAIASVYTKRKVFKEDAMTGEISLTGKVLPIGGVKEKVLAAHRAGIKEVILPQENERNLTDIPEEIKRDLTFHFVTNMNQVINIALEGENRIRNRKFTEKGEYHANTSLQDQME